MKRFSDTLLFLIAGATLGAAIAYLYNYLFGPAEETALDATYQSRLDHALSEGRRAAEEHEAMLRRQLAESQGRKSTSAHL